MPNFIILVLLRGIEIMGYLMCLLPWPFFHPYILKISRTIT